MSYRPRPTETSAAAMVNTKITKSCYVMLILPCMKPRKKAENRMFLFNDYPNPDIETRNRVQSLGTYSESIKYVATKAEYFIQE